MIIDPSSFGSIEDLGHGFCGTEELLHRAQLWQHELDTCLKPGQRFIGLSWPPSAEFFSVLLGIWQCGACAVLLEPGLQASERQSVCDFIPLSVVICPEGEAWPCRTLNSPSDTLTTPVVATFNPARPALALVTSGTTGAPKVVVLSFGALDARLNANIAAIGSQTLKRTLQILSLTFGHGLIGSALTTLVSGGTLVISERTPRLPMRLGQLLDQNRISFLTSVPAFWHIVLKASPRPTMGTLLRAHVGSAPLGGGLWKNIATWTGCTVYNCYGTTETANWVSWAGSDDQMRDGRVGRCTEGSFGIGTSADRLAPSGTGEVWIKTAGLMEGYLGRPDLTASAVFDGWFRTGDLGYLDEEGSLTLLGRTKDEINRAGSKVWPDEIDQLLEKHPEIEQACAFGMPDKISGELLGVAVVRKSGSSITGDELTVWCREVARRELIPDRWFFVDSLCRNNRGKLDRQGQRRLVAGEDKLQ